MKVNRTVPNIEEYLKKAQELFSIDTIPDIERAAVNPPFIEGNCLKRVEDGTIEATISQQVDNRSNAYAVHASLLYNIDNMYGKGRDLKLRALNTYFLNNQECINNCIARILKEDNIYAESDKSSVFLGNGRSISNSGLRFSYRTNTYNYSTDHLFKALVKEEAKITAACLSAIYALVNCIKDKNPDTAVIDKIFKKEKTVSLVESTLVPMFINQEITKERNQYLISTAHYLSKAHDALRKEELLLDAAVALEKKLH